MKKIRIKRGSETNLTKLDLAEFGFTLDTSRLYIGDGISNRLIGNSFSVVKNVVVVTNNIELDKTNFAVLCKAIANDVTVKFPNPLYNQGQIYVIKKISGNKKVVLTSDYSLIEDQQSIQLKIYESITVIACETNWWII